MTRRGQFRKIACLPVGFCGILCPDSRSSWDRFTGFPLDWVSPAASFVVISSDEGLLGFHAADSAQNRKGEHNEMSILRLYRKQGN